MTNKSAAFRLDTVRPKKQSAKPKRKGPRARRIDRNKPTPTDGESHNFSHAGGRKAVVALEKSNGKPSRKSTRGSANRSKPDTGLIRRAEDRINSPHARAVLGK